MRQQQVTIARLGCTVVDDISHGVPDLLVLLCHGFGAPGEDLVPIGREILELSPDLRPCTRFIFPAAPVVLGGYGFFESRAWWRLDEAALEEAVMRGQPLDRRHETPEGLPEAHTMVREIVDQATAEAGLGIDRLVLGGFSQGAMLTTDVTLHLEQNPAGLCIFSGSLMNQQSWKAKMPERRGLPVLQSHGRRDPLLSFPAAEALRDLWMNAGAEVEFLPFDGEHTIPPAAMERFARFLEARCRRR